MKQIPIKLGPLALLLAVIGICLTTLSLLTFTTARADRSLAVKYAETVRTRYELEAKGQELLREAAENGPAALPGAVADENGLFHCTVEQDGSFLTIVLAPDGAGGFRVVQWRQEKEWTEDTSIGSLWSGA